MGVKKKVWNLPKSTAQAVLCEQKLQILSDGVSHSVSYTPLQLTPRVYIFFFFFSWKLLAPPSQCHHRLRCRKILWLYNHVMWYSDPSEQEKLAQSELWPVDEPIGFSGWQRCPQSDQKPVNKGGQNGGASAQLINGTFNTVSTHLDHTTSLYIDLNAAQFG